MKKDMEMNTDDVFIRDSSGSQDVAVITDDVETCPIVMATTMIQTEEDAVFSSAINHADQNCGGCGELTLYKERIPRLEANIDHYWKIFATEQSRNGQVLARLKTLKDLRNLMVGSDHIQSEVHAIIAALKITQQEIAGIAERDSSRMDGLVNLDISSNEKDVVSYQTGPSKFSFADIETMPLVEATVTQDKSLQCDLEHEKELILRDLEEQIQIRDTHEHKIRDMENLLHDLKFELDSAREAAYKEKDAQQEKVAELLHLETTLQQRVFELQKKETAYKQTLIEADSLLRDTEEHYKVQIRELESSQKSLKDRIAQLEKNDSHLQEMLKNAWANANSGRILQLQQENFELERLERELKDKILELEQQDRACILKSQCLDAISQALEKKNKSTKNVVEQIKSILESNECFSEKNRVLEIHNYALQETMRQVDSIIAERESQFKAEISNLKIQTTELKTTNQQLDIALCTTVKEKQEMETNIDALAKRQNISDETLLALTHELDTVKRKLEDKVSQLECMTERFSSLQMQMKSDESREDTELRIADLESQVQTHREYQVQLHETINKLRNELHPLKQAKARNRELISDKAALKHQLEELSKSERRVAHNYKTTKETLKKYEDEIAMLSERRLEADNKNFDLEKKVVSLKQQVEFLEGQDRNATEKIKLLEQMLLEQENTWSVKMKQEVTALKSNSVAAEQKVCHLADVTDENGRLRQAADKLKSQIQSLEHENRNLHEKLEVSTQRCEQIEFEKDEIEVKISMVSEVEKGRQMPLDEDTVKKAVQTIGSDMVKESRLGSGALIATDRGNHIAENLPRANKEKASLNDQDMKDLSHGQILKPDERNSDICPPQEAALREMIASEPPSVPCSSPPSSVSDYTDNSSGWRTGISDTDESENGVIVVSSDTQRSIQQHNCGSMSARESWVMFKAKLKSRIPMPVSSPVRKQRENTKYQNLQRALQEREEQISKFQTNVCRLQKEVDRAKEDQFELQVKRKEVLDLQTEIKKMANLLKSKNDDSSSLKMLQQEIDSLQIELEQMRVKESRSELDHCSFDSDMDRLRSESRETEAELQRSLTENQKLIQRVRIEEQAKKKAEGTVTSLWSQVIELQSTSSKYKKLLADHDVLSEQLQNVVAKNVTELETKDRKIQKLEISAQNCEARIVELESVLRNDDCVKERLASSGSELQSVQLKLTEVEEDNRRLLAAEESLRNDLMKQEGHNNSLLQQLQEKSQVVEELQTTKATLSATEDEVKMCKSKYYSELKKLHRVLSEKRRELRIMSSKVSEKDMLLTKVLNELKQKSKTDERSTVIRELEEIVSKALSCNSHATLTSLELRKKHCEKKRTEAVIRRSSPGTSKPPAGPSSKRDTASVALRQGQSSHNSTQCSWKSGGLEGNSLQKASRKRGRTEGCNKQQKSEMNDSQVEKSSCRPEAPTNLHIDRILGNNAGTHRGAILSWTPSSCSGVRGYEIYMDGKLLTNITNASVNKALLKAMDLTKSHSISIYTVTFTGLMSLPAEIVVQPVSVPDSSRVQTETIQKETINGKRGLVPEPFLQKLGSGKLDNQEVGP